MPAIHPTKRHASPLKNKTLGVAMRRRGEFVCFLEHVSIPLSLAGSRFALRLADLAALSSSNDRSCIAT
jgi:hypothetical protein